MKKYWLKSKILDRVKYFGLDHKGVKVYRDYKNNRVTIDFPSGSIVNYNYDGKYING